MFSNLKRLISSVDPKEKLIFSTYKWWSHSNPLHAFSDLRMLYILRQLKRKDLKDLRVLDVGCGGGLMTERLAELGANVTGVDPTEQAIQIARNHLPSQYKDQVQYINGEITDVNDTFDLILASEVIEHVNNQDRFVGEIAKRLRKNGDLVLSTLNKTFESWFFGILITEYLLGVIEPETHTWEKFVEPDVLIRFCMNHGIQFLNLQGWVLDPVRVQASFSEYSRIGYLMHCRNSQE